MCAPLSSLRGAGCSHHSWLQDPGASARAGLLSSSVLVLVDSSGAVTGHRVGP